MTWDFKPDAPANTRLAVPYIEEANKNTAPNYSSSKTVAQAQADVVEWLEALGGTLLSFQAGTYTIDKKTRLGFVIRFALNVAPFDGAEGLYRVAGLPMRTPTATKERQVKVQALLNVAEQFKAAYMARLFSPDAHPLIPYLLVPGQGQQTVADAVVQIVKRETPLLVSDNA